MRTSVVWSTPPTGRVRSPVFGLLTVGKTAQPAGPVVLLIGLMLSVEQGLIACFCGNDVSAMYHLKTAAVTSYLWGSRLLRVTRRFCPRKLTPPKSPHPTRARVSNDCDERLCFIIGSSRPHGVQDVVPANSLAHHTIANAGFFEERHSDRFIKSPDECSASSPNRARRTSAHGIGRALPVFPR